MKGFTLIEAMIVAAIIGISAAMLVTFFASKREESVRSTKPAAAECK